MSEREREKWESEWNCLAQSPAALCGQCCQVTFFCGSLLLCWLKIIKLLICRRNHCFVITTLLKWWDDGFLFTWNDKWWQRHLVIFVKAFCTDGDHACSKWACWVRSIFAVDIHVCWGGRTWAQTPHQEEWKRWCGHFQIVTNGHTGGTSHPPVPLTYSFLLRTWWSRDTETEEDDEIYRFTEELINKSMKYPATHAQCSQTGLCRWGRAWALACQTGTPSSWWSPQSHCAAHYH